MKLVMKTLGAGFHQPVDSVHSLSFVSVLYLLYLPSFHMKLSVLICLNKILKFAWMNIFICGCFKGMHDKNILKSGEWKNKIYFKCFLFYINASFTKFYNIHNDKIVHFISWFGKFQTQINITGRAAKVDSS